MSASRPRIDISKEARAAALPETLLVNELESRFSILVLQHPQEPDHELGSARLLARTIKNSRLRIGLSWRSLGAALGDAENVDPRRWGVLYLGPQPKWQDPRVLVPVSKKGSPLANFAALDGLVILDGTWSQVKALWWRNAWLLKLQRFVLQPPRPSAYGRLRKEPRRDCVSTIEAVALALAELGEAPAVVQELEASFARMLAAYREARKRSRDELKEKTLPEN